MEVDRRSLMKGMLAGGALLALGTPPWAFGESFPRRPSQCLLLLGGSGADDWFRSGAGAAATGMTYEDLQTVKLKGGLLTDTDRVVTLLKQSRGARLIAVMDDAGAVIFLELARTAGVRLLSMGTHACSTDAASPLRHAWGSTSPVHSAGGLLASQLLQRQGSFSITESFIEESPEQSVLTSWSAPGFSSYRFTRRTRPTCTVPVSHSRRAAGCSVWKQPRGGSPSHSMHADMIPSHVGPENWVESVGYAVTASALGMDSVRESCSSAPSCISRGTASGYSRRNGLSLRHGHLATKVG